MRIVWRLLIVVLVVLAAAGLWYWAIPVIEGVQGSEVERWYQNQLLMAAVLGTGIGVGWAFLGSTRVNHVPRESGAEYDDRVRGHGFWGLALAVGLAVIVGLVGAAVASFVPLGALDRIAELTLDAKFIGVVATAGATMGLAWGATLRIRDGEGSRALIP